MPSLHILLRAALMALAMAELVAAQALISTPAPGPSTDCTTTLISLSSCLDYVTSNDTKPPPKDCCTGLVQVVNENKICLCQLFGSSNPFGLTINETRAVAMPAICKVNTPPLSLCNANGIPVSGPAAAAASSPGSSFAGPAAAAASSPGSSFAGPAGNPTPGSNPASTAGNLMPSVGLFAALVFAAFVQLAV